MATPINNLPLRTQISTDEQKDIQDPMVQDVLKEFQEELNASNRIPQQQVQQSPPQYNIIHQQPINNSLSSNNIYKFDIDIAKKVLIIVIIVGLLSYNSNLLFSLYSKLPEKIGEYFKSYDNIVKLFILFVIYYLLFFYKVL